MAVRRHIDPSVVNCLQGDSMAKRRPKTDQGSRYESVRPARLPAATDELPGSAAKQAILAARRAQRQSLHAPDDARDAAGIALGSMTLAAVALGLADADTVEHVRRNLLRSSMGNPTPEKNSANHEFTGSKNNTFAPGDRIRQARQQRKWRLGRLARLARIDRPLLWRIARRLVTPCLWTIHRVAAALGVCPNWIACCERQAGVVHSLCT